MTTLIPLAQRFRGGVAVNFADLELHVPALNRSLLKKHSTVFQAIQKMALGDASNVDAQAIFDMQAELVFDALLLNYPTMTKEQFDDVVDMLNIQVAFPAACGNLAQASDVKAKNELAVSHYGCLTGTQTPPAL